MIKKLRWQILVVVVTILVVVGLLLTQEPGQQVFAPRPSEGGIYTEGLVGSLSRLNPMLDQNNPADRDINRLLFSGLVAFDARGLPIKLHIALSSLMIYNLPRNQTTDNRRTDIRRKTENRRLRSSL